MAFFFGLFLFPGDDAFLFRMPELGCEEDQGAGRSVYFGLLLRRCDVSTWRGTGMGNVTVSLRGLLGFGCEGDHGAE